MYCVGIGCPIDERTMYPTDIVSNKTLGTPTCRGTENIGEQLNKWVRFEVEWLKLLKHKQEKDLQ